MTKRCANCAGVIHITLKDPIEREGEYFCCIECADNYGVSEPKFPINLADELGLEESSY